MKKFYKNNETGEIVNYSIAANSFYTGETHAERTANGQKNKEIFFATHTEYSEFHPDIEPFLTNEKGNKNKPLYLIPTDFLIANLLRHELWEGCPETINTDVINCIRELKEAGTFPYNSTVGNLFCSKFGLPAFVDHSFLSAVVYECQQVIHAEEAKAAAEQLEIKMSENGFVKATPDLLQKALAEQLKYYVFINGTTFMGDTCIKKKERPMILKDWKEQGLHWMATNAKKSGYRAFEGQYVKQV
jgi:hypothetical protein